jgi:hypothetical protein
LLQGGILCFEVGSYVFLFFVTFPSSHMFSFQRLTSQSFCWEMPLHKGNTPKLVPAQLSPHTNPYSSNALVLECYLLHIHKHLQEATSK